VSAAFAPSQQLPEKSTQNRAVNTAKGASFRFGAANAVRHQRLKDKSASRKVSSADIIRGRRALQAAP